MRADVIAAIEKLQAIMQELVLYQNQIAQDCRDAAVVFCFPNAPIPEFPFSNFSRPLMPAAGHPNKKIASGPPIMVPWHE